MWKKRTEQTQTSQEVAVVKASKHWKNTSLKSSSTYRVRENWVVVHTERNRDFHIVKPMSHSER